MVRNNSNPDDELTPDMIANVFHDTWLTTYRYPLPTVEIRILYGILNADL